MTLLKETKKQGQGGNPKTQAKRILAEWKSAGFFSHVQQSAHPVNGLQDKAPTECMYLHVSTLAKHDCVYFPVEVLSSNM